MAVQQTKVHSDVLTFYNRFASDLLAASYRSLRYSNTISLSLSYDTPYSTLSLVFLSTVSLFLNPSSSCSDRFFPFSFFLPFLLVPKRKPDPNKKPCTQDRKAKIQLATNPPVGSFLRRKRCNGNEYIHQICKQGTGCEKHCANFRFVLQMCGCPRAEEHHRYSVIIGLASLISRTL